MARYWIDLGNWSTDNLKEEEIGEKKKYEEIEAKLQELDLGVQFDENTGGLVFKTKDAEEAKRVLLAARKIVAEADYPAEDLIHVDTQPECEDGHLARFSDNFCSECGKPVGRPELPIGLS